MRKHIPLSRMLLAIFLAIGANIRAEIIPTIQWQASFGGSGYDLIADSIQTGDGGYILGGSFQTGISTNEVPPFPIDYYLVKLDENGEKEWERFYGGDGEDFLNNLIQTSDGGYLLGGYSTSGISNDKSSPNPDAGYDIWILKLDANFNKLWDRSFGTTNNQVLKCLRQTTDGGYIFGAQDHSMQHEYWVVKLNSQGITQWNKRYGGDGYDEISSLQQTTDGGYILAGASASSPSGNKTSPALGNMDAWLVKIDEDGEVQWNYSYGGATYEAFSSVQQTADGGYILCGPRGEELSYSEYWIVKLNSAGQMEWDKSHGPASLPFDDLKPQIQSTSTNGYILCAVQPQEELSFYHDWLLIKMDSAGNKVWQKSFGGSREDAVINLLQTSDGGLLMSGFSQSGVSGDKTSANQGEWDGWVLKLETRLFINRNGQDLTLSWSSISGEAYKVQYKTNLAEVAWTDLATVVASGASASRTESIGSGQRYYRIVGSE